MKRVAQSFASWCQARGVLEWVLPRCELEAESSAREGRMNVLVPEPSVVSQVPRARARLCVTSNEAMEDRPRRQADGQMGGDHRRPPVDAIVPRSRHAARGNSRGDVRVSRGVSRSLGADRAVLPRAGHAVARDERLYLAQFLERERPPLPPTIFISGARRLAGVDRGRSPCARKAQKAIRNGRPAGTRQAAALNTRRVATGRSNGCYQIRSAEFRGSSSGVH